VAVTEAVHVRDAAAAAATVESYLNASALRMVVAYTGTHRTGGPP
jgi:hypothetical protein